jgi:hypothetical protein
VGSNPTPSATVLDFQRSTFLLYFGGQAESGYAGLEYRTAADGNRIPIASRLRKTSLMAGHNRRLGSVRAHSQFLSVATDVPRRAARVLWVRLDSKRYCFSDLESERRSPARGGESPLMAFRTRWQKGCRKDPFGQGSVRNGGRNWRMRPGQDYWVAPVPGIG